MKDCEHCQYCQKRFPTDSHGNYLKGYPGCNYPPYWGKHIDTIGECPKKNAETPKTYGVNWNRG